MAINPERFLKAKRFDQAMDFDDVNDKVKHKPSAVAEALNSDPAALDALAQGIADDPTASATLAAGVSEALATDPGATEGIATGIAGSPEALASISEGIAQDAVAINNIADGIAGDETAIAAIADALPDAEDEAKGLVALNQGTTPATDATNDTDALTASGFNALANDATDNAIQQSVKAIAEKSFVNGAPETNSAGGDMRLFEATANGTNYTGFKAPDLLGENIVYTLPPSDGKLNQALRTDGAGKLYWGYDAQINDIGIPGTLGFGVGIAPVVPSGMYPLLGTNERASSEFGNYQNADRSIVVWIPAFYLRRAHADNPTFPTYGVNSVDIKSLNSFKDEATANSQGYYLHRAFVNAGANQPGFFRDKYDCSLNGTVASSIQGVQPMVSGPAAGQIGFAGATANGQAPTNNYAGAVAAAKSRGAKWFPESVYIADALSTLSEAHAQAATSATHCAWWSAGTTNFPKGNNNSALKDVNDLTVTFTSAGNATYPAFALAGSGAPFAKTTHNGQACGVSDVAGNIYKINPGLTCVATSKTITGATQTNPVRLRIVAHGHTTGQPVLVVSMLGMTQLNNRIFTVTTVDADHVDLDGVDGALFPAWTSGGTAVTGKFYALKSSVDIAALQGGASTATDFWGPASIAANYEEVQINLRTDYPNNSIDQRYGNAGNQVFAWNKPEERLQSMLGMPTLGGVSPVGTAEMGNDYFYQYFRDQLCVTSRGAWANGSFAGSRFRGLGNTRTNANISVGFAACRYL